jgi:dTMP kinase
MVLLQRNLSRDPPATAVAHLLPLGVATGHLEYASGRRLDDFARGWGCVRSWTCQPVGYTPPVNRQEDPPRPRGWLVTIEGPDGAGKTSQALRLRDRMADAGLDAVLTREPGGTSIGERIRQVLLDPTIGDLDPATDALLFNAARARLVREVIRPALDRGAFVISTRFADSTLAYQGYGGGVPLPDLQAMARLAMDGVSPDLTILLDLPAEAGLSRKSGHEVTRFETEFNVDFHRRVRQGFLAIAAEEADRFVVIDATQPPEEVGAAVIRALVRLPELPPVASDQRRGEPRTAPERIHT